MADSSDGGRTVQWHPARGTDLAGTATVRAWVRHALPYLLERPAGDRLADDVELLTGELCTNAVRHGEGLAEVSVSCTATTLRVSVRDHGDGVPVVRNRVGNADADHGRGLLLVAAIAGTWGVDPHPGDGKDVWFELPIVRR